MKTLSFIVFLLLCSGTSDAQERVMPDLPDPITSAKLTRAQDAIEIAGDELKNGSDLQLIESQKNVVNEIVATHQNWMKMGEELPPEKRADKKFVDGLVAEYRSELLLLGTRLTEDVLLPHQKHLMMQKVFAKRVKESDGDLSRVIMEYYPDRIKLGDERKDKLSAISKTTKKEIADIKKKYEAELKRILANSKKETMKLFTESEKAFLGVPQD